jgi:stage V sporulation protein B
LKKSFTAGTMIIICAGLVIKVIGFVARVFISNTVGAKGLGLYQLFYPFYSLVVLTMTSGITVAQSRLVSEAVAKDRQLEIKKITDGSFFMTLLISTVVGVGLFIFAQGIALHIFGDERLILSIKVFSVSIPLISLGGVYKGYFYGLGNISPTAISSIVEQVVRISVVLGFARLGLRYGLAYACMILVIALIAGEIFNVIYLWSTFKMKDSKAMESDRDTRGKYSFNHLKRIFRISFPVSVNRFAMSALTSIEMILIKNALLHSGSDYAYSLEEFGRLSGMVMPMILFPMVFTNAIATTLVPAIAEAQALNDLQKRNARISKALLFSIGSGVVFTSLFLAYPAEIGWGVYRSMRSGEMIYLMAFACTFVYVQQTLIGILNGLEKQGVLFGNTLAGFVIRIGSIFLLTPVFGMEGYIYGYILGSMVMSILSFVYLKKEIRLTLRFGKWFFRPLIIGGILLFFADSMMNVCKLIVGENRVSMFLGCASLVGLGYGLLILFRIIELGGLQIKKVIGR